MSHISFLTYGTRGDVEPFLALAVYFKQRGHDISFAAPCDFKEWVQGFDIEFRPITHTPIRTLLENQDIQAVMEFNLFKLIKAKKLIEASTREYMIDLVADAVPKTDCLIAHHKCMVATDIAEKWDVPLAFLCTVPVLFTPQFSFFPKIRSLNWLTKAILFFTKRIRFFAPSLFHQARQKLGLPPQSRFQKSYHVKNVPCPMLHIFSEHLIPRPKEWPDYSSITGSLFFDDQAKNWHPDPKLAAFLKKGAAPVYIGFGSMVSNKLGNLVDIILATARQNNERVLLSPGWANLKPTDVNDDVFLLGNVPHHALFPHVKAVIHHGGAGTLAAGLRAGCPTLVCPFGLDQPAWGKIVANKQLGPAPIAQKKLTQENFGAAFHDLVNNPIYAENAKELSVLMKKENGLEKTAQTLTEMFGLS